MGKLASSLGREETLTGRTGIWAGFIPFAMKEPIIGHGLGGFFTEKMQKSLGNLPHGHNGYLDILLGIWVCWPVPCLDVSFILV